MRLLFVATKAPWPPRDGGRLLVVETLRALRERGHEVTLVAPVDPRLEDRAAAAAALEEVCTPRLVPSRERRWTHAALQGLARGLPASVARHRKPELTRRIASLLDAERFDVVHAEQLQAVVNCRAVATRARVPVALRAQNVESRLWSGFARGPLAPLARLEARRLRRFEARAVAASALTLALTAEDARALAALGGEARRVVVVRAPFPARLPDSGAELPGAPALVVLAGRGWPPNAAGAAWFEREIWPAVRAAVPGARVHRFGEARAQGETDGVTVHASPADSREAFAPGAILVVPLQVASGVRMKILEAWARGLPVVATPAAAAGLEARAGRELLIATSPDDFAHSVRRLAEDAAFAAEQVRCGRELLARQHDPRLVAARLERCYRAARGEAEPPPADW